MPFNLKLHDLASNKPGQPSNCLYWGILPEAYTEAMAFKNAKPAEGPVADQERRGGPMKAQNGIGVLHISGPIFKRGFIDWFGNRFPGTQTYRDALRLAANDPEIQKVLMVIDSPGGSVDGLSELGDTIREVRAQKPVIAYVDGLAASAAYYIAAQATEIYAERTALIGSIGTLLVLWDTSKMYEDFGIKVIVIKTGEVKGAGIDGTEITEAQQAEFQRMVDFFFADFITAIAKGRGKPKSEIKPMADGRVWPAPEAKTLGLIDGVKTLQEVANAMTKRPRTARAKAQTIGR